MKKKFLAILLVLLMVSAVGIYIQYEKYLPSRHSETHALALSPQQIKIIRAETPITQVQVYKADRVVHLMHHQQIIRTYPMRLGFNPIGHKQQEGDGKTPEGRYTLDWRNAQSEFYKSLHVSYPNQQDKLKAQQLGVSPGGNIMIHGSATQKQSNTMPSLMDYMPRKDWTLGCIAVKNADIDEIWKLVDNGTVIEIYP